MIFLTVGTHEQSFERLIKETDAIAAKLNKAKHECFMQIGYSKYLPSNCEYSSLLSYKEMQYRINNSRIIITHGGPGSIMPVLQKNKIPIVVPRDPIYKEHIDSHQIDFARRLESKKLIIAVYEIESLCEKIRDYEIIISNMMQDTYPSNTQYFVNSLKELLNDSFDGSEK